MNAMAATTEKTNTISVNEMRDYVLNVANGDGSLFVWGIMNLPSDIVPEFGMYAPIVDQGRTKRLRRMTKEENLFVLSSKERPGSVKIVAKNADGYWSEHGAILDPVHFTTEGLDEVYDAWKVEQEEAEEWA
jgi:hypothetical protein